jgi:hypothetical protein
VESHVDLSDLKASSIQEGSECDGFRQVRRGDRIFRAQLERFRDVLEACPTGPLYMKDF